MKAIKISIISTILFIIVLCGIYPLLVFAVGHLLFHHKASGSLIVDKENKIVIGSSLIAQNFQSMQYFRPRPSSAGKDGYDASNSSASNLGPTSQKLISSLQTHVEHFRNENQVPSGVPIPVDAVTSSGSGLDPHISLENALMQVPRVAQFRKLTQDQVKAVVAKYTERPFLGCIGQPRVNVLLLNLELDKIGPQV